MATARALSPAGTRYQPISGRPRIVWAVLDALVLAKRRSSKPSVCRN